MFSWVERNIQLFCFLVGVACAMPLVFLTPPFQVPDEPQHFYRAYQISEGRLRAEVENKIAGSRLPSSLINLSGDFLGSRAIHTERSIIKRPWSVLPDGFAIPLQPEIREFIDFSGAASYSPIPYIPQSLAIAVGRMFDAGPLALLYLARLANVTVAILLVSLAVRRSSFNKAGFMAVVLLPMTVYLFASISPDAMVIGSAFLFTALSLQAHANKKWENIDVLMAIACATIFCSIKIVYAPLILISLFSIHTNENRMKAVGITAAMIVIPISVTFIWLHTVASLIVPVRIGTSVAGQLHHVVADPLSFFSAISHAFIANKFYFFMTIGLLGWLTLKLPAISYVLPILAFCIAVMPVAQARAARASSTLLWWGLLVLSSMGLIMLALYLYWTPVGAAVVEGVQGRYFIPILPLAVATAAGALSSRNSSFSATKALVLVAVLGAGEALLTFASLSHAYWRL